MLIPFRISVSLLVRYIYICLLDPDSSYDISVVKIHWHFALSEALNRYVYVTTFGANCCRLYVYHNVIKRNQGHLVVISVSGLTVTFIICTLLWLTVTACANSCLQLITCLLLENLCDNSEAWKLFPFLFWEKLEG